MGGTGNVASADDALIKANGAPEELFLNDKKCEVITFYGFTTPSDIRQQFIQFAQTPATIFGAHLELFQ